MSEEIIVCPVEECGRKVKWRDASNMKKHIESVHAWSKEEVQKWNDRRLEEKAMKEGKTLLKCEECGVTCTSQKAMSKHMQRHQVSSIYFD